MKRKAHQHQFTWTAQLKATPEQLWPFVSDVNYCLKLLGSPSVKKTQLSRSAPKGFLEITSAHLSSYTLWEQEPFFWEKPYRFGVTRHYTVGFLKRLKFLVNLHPQKKGTDLTVKIWVTGTKNSSFFLVKFFVERILKRRFMRVISEFDRIASNGLLRYENNTPKTLVRGAESRIRAISKELITETRRKRIINHLIQFIRKADDQDLARIHPFMLAEYWGEKKYSVLNVFLHAAKLDLLDFSWDVCCPNCKSPRTTFRKLKESRTAHFCEDCDLDFELDFNKNTHLVFSPHPLIRKISEKRYSFGDPTATPHKVSQHFLSLGESKYLDIKLEEGTYLFKSHNHKGELLLHAREDGMDTITLYLTDEDFNNQEVSVSTHPNITLINHSSKRQVCFIEKKDWKEEATYASEVSSVHDFRTLFPRETLKDGQTVRASGVTMLFTDLMNSTELYRQEGDEFAIGRVMSHFKIIQQIIAEERGGIVKTIGDSVMAVFREPVSALKAVERIQQIFTGSTGIGDSFKIKAGIHYGDCTAVNLNDRTDYFGTTVNIAARLVDVAKEKEIIISDAVYNHPDVLLYLKKKEKILFVKEDNIELKGFEDEAFKVKQIRLERPSLRLVI
ncbi:MAG: adenylate/guanylate cyclase domain-containing protein [Balneolales bacterium]|nr:adenylate/guanylate cyclase domain-containing protein [Balneolales bacterium]